jgi:phosphoribosylaminoimidazolecarboxamide formyltransferase/IMP cyclohydrolase
MAAAHSDGPDICRAGRAIISVADKTGVVDFARGLADAGVEIVSTGGTARALAQAGIAVTEVSALTGMPEVMDGRLKTLHPRVHGGLLAIRDDAGHVAAMRDLGIPAIDLLVVDLYPFEAAVAEGAGAADAIEQIDIGGPAMIRAAAKNCAYVAVVTDPADYPEVLRAVAAGGTSRTLRLRLAAKAFARTAAYDAAIAGWYAARAAEDFPSRLVLAGRLAERLRYGENPHQGAALYRTEAAGPSVAGARQAQGKALSYNNIADADAAFELVCDLPRDRPAAAIVKHANPCGAASAERLSEAYAKALACDPVSAYGGVIALNARIDAATAERIADLFTEVVVAPEADESALAIFGERPNLRVLLTGGIADPAAPRLGVKSIAGGFLAQFRDAGVVARGECRVVTRRAPSDAEMADLLFAFTVAKHVKSNAIVYARDGATVGIGAGQMSRVDAARTAAIKAAEAAAAQGLSEPLTRGSVVASDAFFPFADGLHAAAEAGATAAIQPGGSLRDGEVIAAADEAGIAMVFTGIRHFRH